MQIVIKISEDDYRKVQEGRASVSMMRKAIRNGTPLDKIRAEIEKAVWEDVVVSLDGTDEVRITRLDPDDVFDIIDKYKAESEERNESV